MSESDEMIAYFDWVNVMINFHPFMFHIFHVPNGGRRDGRTGARLKREGVRRGVPDIYVDIPVHPFHGLRIELKVEDNKPTTEQIAWLSGLARLGYLTKVCFSAQEAIGETEKYLGLTNEIPSGLGRVGDIR